ncbi:hypothetical protein GEMRC1_000104 [Eukaryota sp. GEM-RC1]
MSSSIGLGFRFPSFIVPSSSLLQSFLESKRTNLQKSLYSFNVSVDSLSTSSDTSFLLSYLPKHSKSIDKISKICHDSLKKPIRSQNPMSSFKGKDQFVDHSLLDFTMSHAFPSLWLPPTSLTSGQLNDAFISSFSTSASLRCPPFKLPVLTPLQHLEKKSTSPKLHDFSRIPGSLSAMVLSAVLGRGKSYLEGGPGNSQTSVFGRFVERFPFFSDVSADVIPLNFGDKDLNNLLVIQAITLPGHALLGFKTLLSELIDLVSSLSEDDLLRAKNTVLAVAQSGRSKIDVITRERIVSGNTCDLPILERQLNELKISNVLEILKDLLSQKPTVGIH